MENAKKFKAAINRTFSEKGGVFWQGVSDRQLTTYVMQVLREFSASQERKILRGSFVIGRQPNMRRMYANGIFLEDNIEAKGPYQEKDDYDTAVYIFNENVQVSVFYF